MYVLFSLSSSSKNLVSDSIIVGHKIKELLKGMSMWLFTNPKRKKKILKCIKSFKVKETL